MSTTMDKSLALTVCTALGQSVRMDVVRALVRAGDDGLPAGVIADAVGVSHNLLSSHLGRLGAAELVSSERRGRSIIYRARYDTLRGLLAFLMHDCCQGRADVLDGLMDGLPTAIQREKVTP
ncbi:MAG: helix-turn-helix domain-containing protein [Pseudomonadota bacterium]